METRATVALGNEEKEGRRGTQRGRGTNEDGEGQYTYYVSLAVLDLLLTPLFGSEGRGRERRSRGNQYLSTRSGEERRRFTQIAGTRRRDFGGRGGAEAADIYAVKKRSTI